VRKLITEEDRKHIREAVSRAEQKTSGEIVPYIVKKSAQYEVVFWRGMAMGGVLGLCFLFVVTQFYRGWGMSLLYTDYGQAITILGCSLCAAILATFVPPVKRMLAGSHRLTASVHQRALEAFVEKEVFNTRDRTGILLFVSLFEHRIEVIGDSGINQKVGPDDWSEVVLCIRKGVKSGKIAQGLAAGIKLSGDLLERSGVAIRLDDTNELSDDVTVRE